MCPNLKAPLYGGLVLNGTFLAWNQPEWQENDTVVMQCDYGFELVDSAGQSAGRRMEITCMHNGVWSHLPHLYSCTSEPSVATCSLLKHVTH